MAAGCLSWQDVVKETNDREATMTAENPMDANLQQLEDLIDHEPPVSAEALVNKYRTEDPTRPVWRLIEDIQWQAMAYTNLIERLKAAPSEAEVTQVRDHFVNLGLVPSNMPNPLGSTLLKRARSKLSKYRKVLVDILRDHGQDLLRELHFGIEGTVTAQVSIGTNLSVVLGLEYTAAVNQR
jgi:hypothetical protein